MLTRSMMLYSGLLPVSAICTKEADRPIRSASTLVETPRFRRQYRSRGPIRHGSLPLIPHLPGLVRRILHR